MASGKRTGDTPPECPTPPAQPPSPYSQAQGPPPPAGGIVGKPGGGAAGGAGGAGNAGGGTGSAGDAARGGGGGAPPTPLPMTGQMAPPTQPTPPLVNPVRESMVIQREMLSKVCLLKINMYNNSFIVRSYSTYRSFDCDDILASCGRACECFSILFCGTTCDLSHLMLRKTKSKSRGRIWRSYTISALKKILFYPWTDR